MFRGFVFSIGAGMSRARLTPRALRERTAMWRDASLEPPVMTERETSEMFRSVPIAREALSRLRERGRTKRSLSSLACETKTSWA